MRKISILLFQLILFLQLEGQDNHKWHLEKWTTKDGLPDDNIKCIFKDKAGFLWLGTGEGLARFDGIHFINFLTYGANPYDTIPVSGAITGIIQDDKEQIWFSHNQGISRLNPKSFAIKYYHPTAHLTKDHRASRATDIVYSKTIGVCAVSENGFWVYNSEVDSFTLYLHSEVINSIPSNQILFKGLEDDYVHNGLWLGTDKGVSFFDSKKKVFYHRANNPFHWKIFEDSAIYTPIAIFVDSKNRLWYSKRSDPDLYCFDIMANTVQKIENQKQQHKLYRERDYINFYEEPDTKSIWLLGRTEDAYQMDPLDFEIRSIHTFVNPFEDFPSQFRSILKTEDKILWFGSVEGLYRYVSPAINYHEIPFEYFRAPTTTQACIYFDKTNQCWIGTNGEGLIKVDLISGKHQRFYQLNQDFEVNCYRYILQEDDRFLWLGTFKGLYIFDQVTNEIISIEKKYPELYKITGSKPIMHLHKNLSGQLIICIHKAGACVFDPVTQKMQRFYRQTGLNMENLRYSFQSADGLYWFASNSTEGITSFDPKTNRYTNYLPDNKKLNWLNGINVNYLMEDSNGQIWCSTLNEGIYLLDRNKNIFIRLGVNSEISNAKARPIAFSNPRFFESWDRKVFIMESTGRISYYNLNDKSFHVIEVDYTFKDKFSSAWFTKDNLGQMFIGNQGRLIWFSIDSISIDNQHDHVLPKVTKIQWFNNLYAPQEWESNLTLNNNSNNVQLFFSPLDFKTKDHKLYEYKLEGLESNWHKADLNFEATYTNLPTGNFKFKTRFVNNVEEEKISLSIIVLPPWYETWWFRLLLLFAFASVVYFFIRMRTQKIVKEQRNQMEKQKAVELERERIARDMHDDLGSGLSALHLLSNIATNKLTNQEAKSELEQIVQSSAELNQRMREMIWTVNSNDDTLSSLCYFLKNYCNLFSNQSGINLDFENSISNMDIPVSADKRRNLFLSMKEVLNNISKHAGANNIKVCCSLNNSILEISIQDDGVGFEVDWNQIAGYGLKNIRKRMYDLKGTFEIVSQEGTLIKLKINI